VGTFNKKRIRRPKTSKGSCTRGGAKETSSRTERKKEGRPDLRSKGGFLVEENAKKQICKGGRCQEQGTSERQNRFVVNQPSACNFERAKEWERWARKKKGRASEKSGYRKAVSQSTSKGEWGLWGRHRRNFYQSAKWGVGEGSKTWGRGGNLA